MKCSVTEAETGSKICLSIKAGRTPAASLSSGFSFREERNTSWMARQPWESYLLSLCRKGMSAAIKGGRDRLIHERLCRRTQQLAADQQKDIALSHRQRRHIRLFQLQGGNQGVVVGYLLVIHQRQNIGEKLRAGVEGRHPRRQMQDYGGGLRHVAGQISAIRARIGQQLLFIERLGVVQGLLGRVAKRQIASGDASAVKHLVGNLTIAPGGVDQVLHVPAILNFPGKEGQLVQKPVEMHFLVNVGLVGFFLNDIQLFQRVLFVETTTFLVLFSTSTGTRLVSAYLSFGLIKHFWRNRSYPMQNIVELSGLIE